MGMPVGDEIVVVYTPVAEVVQLERNCDSS